MNEVDYLKETPLLNYSHPSIESLIKSSGWRRLSTFKQIGAIHDFIRDGIRFGYNEKDTLKASEVLTYGIGQCNTKGILMMALLRALKIPCKMEAFHVDSSFQKDLLPPLMRKLSPNKFLHTRILVLYEGAFVPLEGFILDTDYLNGLKAKFKNHTGPFYAYAVATKDFNHLHIDFKGGETFIQKEAITESLGIYDDPDTLLSEHGQNLSRVKSFLFAFSIRHLMNKRVEKIRRL